VHAPDEMYRWWHSRVNPCAAMMVDHPWSNLHTDIHERKQAEEKIKDQERELRQIVDVAPQHVSVVGPTGNISMPTGSHSIITA